MTTPLSQHQVEIRRNLAVWENKLLLREIYSGFYDRILKLVDLRMPGKIVEIGSGVGNLKSRLPQAITTDLFPNPWLDVVCDGYELPFAERSVSHLILFDVFHHLEASGAFLGEACRVLVEGGRLVLFEPYISLFSFPLYGLFHHEPVAWRQSISLAKDLLRPRAYYAAQGNATRLFFLREREDWPEGWSIFHTEVCASLSYVLSGGFGRPALYPARCLPLFQRVDRWLSRWPRLFGVRCLVGLRPD